LQIIIIALCRFPTGGGCLDGPTRPLPGTEVVEHVHVLFTIDFHFR
jgi:hypothetical protein